MFIKTNLKGGPLVDVIRVAIIGSGPSGFYAAEALQKQDEFNVEIDMYERLPTPYGLVRGGVAPDHQKIKSVTKIYDRIAKKPNFRFFGNVEFGTDVTRADLANYYHAIIYAVGAQTDRRLDIPGEDLPGSHPATEFVAWYNAHPDYRTCEFDLSADTAAVIGVGNVAVDVMRILTRTPEELAETDIADYALEELKASTIRTVYVFGRRGPAQAKFTPTELKELGKMADVDVVVEPGQLELDDYSQAYVDSDDVDRHTLRNLELLADYADRGAEGKGRRIVFRFMTSPAEILGDGQVEAIKVVKNELYEDPSGRIRPRSTDQYETIPVGLVFRSVGYHGVPLPGVPFYDKWGIIPNDRGRVLDGFKGEQVIGDYVVGWIKRGPSGVIGTNKPDSAETVDRLIEDAEQGKLLDPPQPTTDAVLDFMSDHKPDYVTYQDWEILDQIEVERGEAEGRPRVKFSTVDAMLEAIREYKAASQNE
jgi:ferredoxin--NADP+ reductase